MNGIWTVSFLRFFHLVWKVLFKLCWAELIHSRASFSNCNDARQILKRFCGRWQHVGEPVEAQAHKHAQRVAATHQIFWQPALGTQQNVPCRRLWKPLWSPPRCRCLSSSGPSWSGTQESRWFHCLCEHAIGNLSLPKNGTTFLFRTCLRFGFSPSASTSLIMSWSSASVGFWPRERITVPSSLVVMVPSPSLSNSENASLNSAKRRIQGTFPSNACLQTRKKI